MSWKKCSFVREIFENASIDAVFLERSHGEAGPSDLRTYAILPFDSLICLTGLFVSYGRETSRLHFGAIARELFL
jgi:hypothetical protein